MAGGNYEGLAKLAILFAIIFGVSLGLCGATFLLGNASDGGGDMVMPLGMLELAGMAFGAVGLVVIGLAALGRWMASLRNKGKVRDE